MDHALPFEIVASLASLTQHSHSPLLLHLLSRLLLCLDPKSHSAPALFHSVRMFLSGHLICSHCTYHLCADLVSPSICSSRFYHSFDLQTHFSKCLVHIFPGISEASQTQPVQRESLISSTNHSSFSWQAFHTSGRSTTSYQ